jgi:hypothetical protein
MDTKFRDRITKLLNLTTSPNDNEALSAMRMANESINKSGLTWNVLIGDFQETKATPKPQQSKTNSYSPENTIEEMFEFIYENAWDDFDFSFIDSIQEWYESSGNLTYKQVKGLKSIYEKVMEHSERVS